MADTEDSAGGWDDEEYMTFDPEIELEWAVGPDNVVVFTPHTGPKPELPEAA